MKNNQAIIKLLTKYRMYATIKEFKVSRKGATAVANSQKSQTLEEPEGLRRLRDQGEKDWFKE